MSVETALGVLNGVVGDYLAREGNGLATAMTFCRDGQPITGVQIAARIASECDLASPVAAWLPEPLRIVVLVHGLMSTDRLFRIEGSDDDYGTLLARDAGYFPLALRYNSGLSIAENGDRFARLLDELVAALPAKPDEILLIGHSMGGLVIRAACHAGEQAHHAWLPLVKRAIYIGTPHRGAPLERGGRFLAKLLSSIPEPVTNLIGEISNLRSAGIRDLGDADLTAVDRARLTHAPRLRDAAHPVPLLPCITHGLIAGTVTNVPEVHQWFGDAMVPLGSAHADSAFAEQTPVHTQVVAGLAHAALQNNARVYMAIDTFLKETASWTK